MIPIHFLQMTHISVTAIINARIPIVLVPPMTIVSDGTKIVGYRTYYQTTLGASSGIDKLTAYNHRVAPISAFWTDPCLYPRYALYSIEDFSLGNGECYPSHEGRRMIQKAQESLQLHGSTLPKSRFNKNGSTSPSAQKRQTTLTQNAVGQVYFCSHQLMETDSYQFLEAEQNLTSRELSILRSSKQIGNGWLSSRYQWRSSKN